ncbi:hypothetical protein GRS48_12910 [Halorubrum sp. JWXQ-INN 858]|uniref:hypothetical protein n=1 Tax=Halorubrum sp. JWXQ-INN 858 TaxID=2690782 RepID=UPI00135A261F|nr:hypothetical protein [Halorubrum sp. JWXQ-INN 858]MWV65713.1 hypothetical protein [Halorubrum sp. JWXQ-INN 858]
MSVSLAEPQVLARAKRRLFPDDDEPNAYAVTDTQFAADTWNESEPIPAAVHEALAPFNHVAVGSGYPDLVGVRRLEPALLAVDRLGDDPPLVAVEAKGYTAAGTVDVERGIVQAHDRLGEANAAYVAAPGAAVSPTNLTLARELNVGVLAVDPDGGVSPAVVPRLVGHAGGRETNAVRFQASAQGVTDRSFPLNHPKNYLGYAIALAAPGDVDALVDTHVVSAVRGARRGAVFLGLVDDRPDGPRLTPLGEEVVRFALREHGSLEDALAAFDGWKRSRTRFVDLAPRWGEIARRVVWSYPATRPLVTEIQRIHDAGEPAPSLVDLVTWLHRTRPSFAVELFVRGDETVRRRVLTPDGDLRRGPLTEGGSYHSPTVFQLKAVLYHAGFLTETGAEPTRLDPTADVWALREPVSVPYS